MMTMFVSENSQQLVGKIDPVNTKQVVSHLGNENRAQVVPQLGKHFRKQSLSSPRRGNETLAQGIALGIIAQTNNVLKGQKHYRYVTITL